jgi:lysophospholipase L1-like esterase
MYWYEEDIKGLENKTLTQGADGETIFYGSSSIRLWTTLDEDFEGYKPVNLGFGGSTLAACVWFFDRVMAPYHPKRLVLYAGDNDLGDGRHPEEVFIFFQDMALRARKRFGDMPCYFISLKPSISRFSMVDNFKYTNQLISDEISQNLPNWHYIDIFKEMLDPSGKPNKEYFMPDGLHLSPKGYQVWTGLVKPQLGNI